MEKPMTLTARILRLAAPLLGICSVLMILAATNLFFASWLFVHDRPFWALFWAGGGAAFVVYAVVTLLALAKRIPAQVFDAVRPVLLLGAAMLALAGAAGPDPNQDRRGHTRGF